MNSPSGEEDSQSISSENLTKWIVKHLTSSNAREELLQIFPPSSTMLEERRESQKRGIEAVIKSEIEDVFEEPVPVSSVNLLDCNLQQALESQSKCRCEEVLDVLQKQEQLFTKMFHQLSDEIASLRKDITSLKKRKHNYEASCLPKTPFTNVEEFSKFEQSLKEDDDTFLSLRRELTLFNVSDPEKFVKIAFKTIFNDEIAQQFCWRGTPEKQSVRDLRFTTAVKCAFRDKFQEIDEDIFVQVTMKHFQYAKDRLQKKMRYSSLKAPTATSNTPSEAQYL